jgi:fructose-bisphosphate aldolase, class II
MKNQIDYIKDAESQGRAVGHFNISNSEILTGIFNAAKSLNLPVVIGLSEGERDFIGVKQAVALVKSLREEHDYPIFVNADHTYDILRVKEAVDAGFDSIVVDGTKLSLEENIKLVKESISYAKDKNPDILIEAEIGYIGESSKILNELPDGAGVEGVSLPTAEQAKYFVDETGVDLLAPAVGNIHGMLRGSLNPKLDIERIKEIKEAVGVPLVLHGGSGISDDDFKSAIKAGISMVHVNTEIRLAFRDGLKLYMQENPDEIAPYRIMKDAVKAVEKKTAERLSLFNGGMSL